MFVIIIILFILFIFEYYGVRKSIYNFLILFYFYNFYKSNDTDILIYK